MPTESCGPPVGYEYRRDPGAHLAVQDDGNMVIYQGSSPLWATNTVTDHQPGGGPPP